MVLEVYRIVRTFPDYEKFGMMAQIRRAAVSVHLNITEGCSRKSKAERNRFYEVARGSLIEVDAGLDIAKDLGYCTILEGTEIVKLVQSCFHQLTAMMR